MKTVKTFAMLLLLTGCVACNKGLGTDTFVDSETVINSRLYSGISTEYYTIEGSKIEGDKLVLKITTGGCSAEAVTARLVDSGKIAESYPPQRFARIELKNPTPDCKMLITLEYVFDLKPLQVANVKKVTINLDGLKKGLLYQY